MTRQQRFNALVQELTDANNDDSQMGYERFAHAKEALAMFAWRHAGSIVVKSPPAARKVVRRGK